jgi:hypothetical protein
METVPTGQARALGFAALAAAAFAAGAFALWHLARRVEDLTARAATNEAVLQEILGEVTRLRLERSASALGPAGLLEKLRTYAPLVASSRVPEPDYRAAIMRSRKRWKMPLRRGAVARSSEYAGE